MYALTNQLIHSLVFLYKIFEYLNTSEWYFRKFYFRYSTVSYIYVTHSGTYAFYLLNVTTFKNYRVQGLVPLIF